MDGKCPSNLSGGLLGTMHAVGATGIFQAASVCGNCSRNTINFMVILRSGRDGGKRNPRIGRACRSLKGVNRPFGSPTPVWVPM